MVATDPVSIALSTFVLIALAEMGDKSQLVCMTLAARFRHWPVLLGASIAFILLNTLAVVFGAAVAEWIPERIMAIIVAILFAVFGIQALFFSAQDEDDANAGLDEKTGHSIFITTFLLIMVAEFGDKTQLAVAGLASSLPALAVWAGASLALVVVSALGVWAGRTVLQRLPLQWLQRAGGILFLMFASLAAWKVWA
jgi:putative Ca2+/H+ antiporter (TMEM165/GDT1 family)